MLEQQQLAIIRDRNDAVRRHGLNTMVTRRIRESEALEEVLYAVRNFESFDSNNDPYGEHDFGSFELKRSKYFWKIDYYDQELKYWSDPLDAKTKRVLTVMLAEEY